MEMNETELNEQLKFFLDNNIKFHVDLKDGIFLNGFVLEKSKENVWRIKEDKLGEVFLFTKSIFKLQQFIEHGGQNE
jgi:hypothetical protein